MCLPNLATGLAACTDCEPGYYSWATGSTFACRHCSKGKHANKSGSVACDDCPAGRYGNSIAETRAECAGLCAEGHYGDKPAATSRQCSGPCAMGNYSRPGATKCKICPEGRYGSVVGSGVVGFTTPVCTGVCYGAAPGSTCCPPSREWAGNCPGDAAPSPSPSPSGSSPEVPSPSPGGSSSDSSSTYIGLVVAVVGIVIFVFLAAGYVYSRSREEQDAGGAEAHVAEDDTDEQRLQEEQGSKPKKENTKENKHGAVRAAHQVVPLSTGFAASSTTDEEGERSSKNDDHKDKDDVIEHNHTLESYVVEHNRTLADLMRACEIADDVASGYIAQLKSNGYETIKDLLHMSLDDFVHCSVERGHGQRLIRELERRRSKAKRKRGVAASQARADSKGTRAPTFTPVHGSALSVVGGKGMRPFGVSGPFPSANTTGGRDASSFMPRSQAAVPAVSGLLSVTKMTGSSNMSGFMPSSSGAAAGVSITTGGSDANGFVPATHGVQAMYSGVQGFPISGQAGLSKMYSNTAVQGVGPSIGSVNSTNGSLQSGDGSRIGWQSSNTSLSMQWNGTGETPPSFTTLPTYYESCQHQIELWQQIEIRRGEIVRTELLGQGAFAEVYKGRALGVECAIKLFRKTATAKHRQEAMAEIKLAASLDHPCTIRILGWTRAPLQTMTELCRGDLIAFYKNKIDGMEYSELEALRLLKVG